MEIRLQVKEFHLRHPPSYIWDKSLSDGAYDSVRRLFMRRLRTISRLPGPALSAGALGAKSRPVPPTSRPESGVCISPRGTTEHRVSVLWDIYYFGDHFGGLSASAILGDELLPRGSLLKTNTRAAVGHG